MIARQARFRVAILVSGLVLIGMWFAFGGGSQSIIAIEFGISPRDFVGVEVVIDGEVAGRLQRMGARTQTGFKVDDGDHVVTLRHPELRTVPVTVTSGFAGQPVVLLADFSSTTNDAGESETVIILNR